VPVSHTTLFDVPARQATYAVKIDSLESMLGLFKRLQIRTLHYNLLCTHLRTFTFPPLPSPVHLFKISWMRQLLPPPVQKRAVQLNAPDRSELNASSPFPPPPPRRSSPFREELDPHIHY
jgi:hypothetical protein